MTVHTITLEQQGKAERIDPYYLTDEWIELRNRVVRRDLETCYYCGLKGFQADHIVPRSHGGPDKMTNLVCCCDRCNAILGSKFFISPGEKRRYVQDKISGRKYYPAKLTRHKDVPYKFNGMTPAEYQAYLVARRARTTAAKEREGDWSS